jgi:hypothetical protein
MTPGREEREMRYDGEGDRDPEWMDGSIRRALVGLEVCNRCRMLRRSAHGEYRLPSRRRIHEALDALLAFLFPGCHGQGESDGSEDVGRREHCLRTTIRDLIDQSESAFRYACERGDCVDCGDCRTLCRKYGQRFRRTLRRHSTAIPRRNRPWRS